MLPQYPRDSTYKYYSGCLDGEEDIFQYNFGGGSGKIYMGKNGKLLLYPLSKMRVEITSSAIDRVRTDSLFCTIQKFIITTEDGVRYIFNERETQTTTVINCVADTASASPPPAYMKYGTAWYLSEIVSLAHDTIKIRYTTTQNRPTPNTYQSVKILSTGAITHSDTSYAFVASANTQITNRVISEIKLPDAKSVTFLYSQPGQFRNNIYPVLQRIKVMDSAFRYGYMFNWDTTNLGAWKKSLHTIRLF